MVAKAIVGHVDSAEDEATFINLYTHLLAEGTTHEEAVEVATRMTFVGKGREVHVLENAMLDAFMGVEQVM